MRLSSLPQNLTSLNVQIHQLLEESELKYPPHLTKLWLKFSGYDTTAPWLHHLPPGLLDFKWKAPFSESEDLSASLLSVNLPRSITNLSLPQVSLDILLTIVPPSATKLENNYPSGEASDIWNAAQLSQWERKRPELRFRELLGYLPEMIDGSLAKFLPSTLTSLDRPIALSALADIPRGVRGLAITQDDITPDSEDSDQEWDELPDDENEPLPAIWMIKGFPEALETLEIHIDFLAGRRWLPSLHNLPHLTSLFVSHNFSPAEIELLPSTLTQLIVVNGNLFEYPKSTIPALPRGLKNIVSRVKPHKWYFSQEVGVELAHQMPPNLEILEFVVANLSIHFIAQLPSSLTVLKLALADLNVLLPSGSESQSFPSSLQEISITFLRADAKTFACHKLFDSLPKDLRSFSLIFMRTVPEWSVSIDDIKKLPKHLEALHLPDQPALAADSMQHLPKGLRVFFVGSQRVKWPK
jgi:Leucine-rich repeat (LRR) protein